jgi:hypothetical protein
MEYKGIKFEAIMATPGAGKSYLCDRYSIFVDADEVRLRCKYVVPEKISREELEKTKGIRTFLLRDGDIRAEIEKKLDEARNDGKILITSPHPEFFEYFESRKIPFCFVYQGKDTRIALIDRFNKRGNVKKVIEEFAGEEGFEYFYNKNINENRPTVKYEFSSDEYLSDIIRNQFKFDY